ncbi:hypothetical protein FRC12_014806 [Ceratobasidium sp. 428]|nr:hypothetical protein FRC12_014806 [Ceratobasidium sp. 428]
MIGLVKKILTGELKDTNVFLGLMEVMAEREDCLLRGKGMQGYSQPPALAGFCQAFLVSSPRNYRMIEKDLPVPTERALQIQCSRMPSFHIGICNDTTSRAVAHLTKIKYNSSVSVGCDNLQLLSKLSPYHDGQKQKWYLLGGVGKLIEIDDDIEGVEQQVVDSTEKCKLATMRTQCHLWTIQVPTPGIPVFILAALPINSTLKAPDLLFFHNGLVNNLLEAGVCMVSYATDGSPTEFNVSTRFLEGAESTDTTLIPIPDNIFPIFQSPFITLDPP